MSKTREITAAVVIVTRPDGRFLAVERGVPPGLEFPGGKVRSGESPLDAAAREVLEETGVGVTDLVEIDLFRWTLRDRDTGETTGVRVTHLYVARATGAAVPTVSGASWVTEAELRARPVNVNVMVRRLNTLAAYRAGSTAPATAL